MPGAEGGRSTYTARRGRIDGVETLTLESSAAGGIEAHFAPGAGMVGCSLLHEGEQVLGVRNGLRAYVERHSTMGIPLLYPWANRLGEFAFSVAGRPVRLDADSPHVSTEENGLPIHGLLAAADGWRVEAHEADDSSARLRARFAFDEASRLTDAFPFPHELEVSVELRAARLGIATTVRASADSPVPISFGFHPYLCLPGVRREEWRISVPAREHLVLDDRGLPTGDREPAAIESGPLGDRTFDDAFTPIEGEPFTLSGGGREVALRFGDGYPFSQLYAPPGQDLIAYEPMTAPTNALVTGSELTVLEPGDAYEAAFELGVERVA